MQILHGLESSQDDFSLDVQWPRLGWSAASGYNGSIKAAPKVETGRGCMRCTSQESVRNVKYNIVLPGYDVGSGE